MEAQDYSSKPPGAKTLAVFKDPNEIKRSVCSISWHPDAGRKMACAYAIMQFQDHRLEEYARMWHSRSSTAAAQQSSAAPHSLTHTLPSLLQVLVRVVYLGQGEPEHARVHFNAALAVMLPRVQPEGYQPSRRWLLQWSRLGLRYKGGLDAEGGLDH